MMSVVAVLLWGMLCLGMAGAQDATAASPQPSAKRDIRNAGSRVKRTTKRAGHAVKRTGRKAVHKTAAGTERAAAKIRSKTAR